MPTVCIDCRYINDRPSGIGEVVRALVEYVPPLAPDIDFLLLVSPRAPGALSSAANVRELIVPAAANGPGTMWWLPQLADLRQVDVFHATFNILPAGLAMPTITTVHDIMWLTRPELCAQGLAGQVRAAFFRHGIRRALARSTIIAAVSEATRQDIMTWQADARSRCHVTLSGVSSQFQPQLSDRRWMAAMGLDPQMRLVLTVGQAAPYKNHDGALEAFALAARERPDIALVLVQRMGSDANRLMRRAERMGLARRVVVLPQIDRAHLIDLYSHAAVLLHPSLCEGFGNPLAEAMACGCPVVTSNVSAMPEVTAGAALLADPTDVAALAVALGRVLDQPALAQRMRDQGLARAANLRWESFASANLSLYRLALHSHQAQARDT